MGFPFFTGMIEQIHMRNFFGKTFFMVAATNSFFFAMERLSKFLFNRGVFFTLKRFSASLHQRFGCWICRTGRSLGTRFSEVRRQQFLPAYFVFSAEGGGIFFVGGEGGGARGNVVDPKKIRIVCPEQDPEWDSVVRRR